MHLDLTEGEFTAKDPDGDPIHAKVAVVGTEADDVYITWFAKKDLWADAKGYRDYCEVR